MEERLGHDTAHFYISAMCIQPNSNGPSLINWAIERRYDHWQAETEKTEIKLSWTVRNYFSLIITVVSFFCQCVASAVVIIVLVIFISRLGYGGQGNCLSGFFLWPKISFPKALERPRAESIPPHTWSLTAIPSRILLSKRQLATFSDSGACARVGWLSPLWEMVNCNCLGRAWSHHC